MTPHIHPDAGPCSTSFITTPCVKTEEWLCEEEYTTRRTNSEEWPWLLARLKLKLTEQNGKTHNGHSSVEHKGLYRFILLKVKFQFLAQL